MQKRAGRANQKENVCRWVMLIDQLFADGSPLQRTPRTPRAMRRYAEETHGGQFRALQRVGHALLPCPGREGSRK